MRLRSSYKIAGIARLRVSVRANTRGPLPTSPRNSGEATSLHVTVLVPSYLFQHFHNFITTANTTFNIILPSFSSSCHSLLAGTALPMNIVVSNRCNPLSEP